MFMKPRMTTGRTWFYQQNAPYGLSYADLSSYPGDLACAGPC